MANKIFRTLALIGLLGLSIASCKKSEAPRNEKAQIDPLSVTRSEYDSTIFGVYVGAFVGSSGTFKAIIDNGTHEVIIYLLNIVADNGNNYSDTLTSDAVFQIGTPIVNAHFVGKHASSLDLTLRSANNVQISNIKINGDLSQSNPVAVAVKNTITKPSYVYIGTFSGDNGLAGNFNLIRYGNTVFGLAKPTAATNPVTHQPYTDEQITQAGSISGNGTQVGNTNDFVSSDYDSSVPYLAFSGTFLTTNFTTNAGSTGTYTLRWKDNRLYTGTFKGTLQHF